MIEGDALDTPNLGVRLRISRPVAPTHDGEPKKSVCAYCSCQLALLPHEFRVCQSPTCIGKAIADRDERILEIQLSIPRVHSQLFTQKSELEATIVRLEADAPDSKALHQYRAILTSLKANLGFNAKSDLTDQVLDLEREIRELAKRINRPSFLPAFRRELWERDRQTCYLCHKVISDPGGDSMHVDHVRARSEGGSDEAYNLRIAHPLCNLRKGDKELSGRRMEAILRQLRKTAEEEAKERLF